MAEILTMTTFTVLLPWPPKELSPNRRGGRSWSFNVAKGFYRDHCRVLIHNVWVKSWKQRPKWTEAVYSLTVLCGAKHRGKNKPDQDNLIASLKYALDGLQAVGIVENDRGLTLGKVVFVETKAKSSLIELSVVEKPTKRAHGRRIKAITPRRGM